MNVLLLNEQMQAKYHSQGDTGVGCIPCIVDSGIDPKYFTVIARPFDGTAHKNHGSRVAGVIKIWAPDSDLIDYNVFPDGEGSELMAIEALRDVKRRALTDPKHQYLVNISQACQHKLSDSPTLREYLQAIIELEKIGVPVIVAGGNIRGQVENLFPAMFDAAIAVAGMLTNGTSADTSRHKFIDFIDHAENVPCGVGGPFGGLETISETSAAAPTVTGKAILVQCAARRTKGYWLTVPELKEALKAYADDFGLEGKDDVSGFGFINLLKDIKGKEEETLILQKGDKGEKVEQLQNLLLALGYPVGKIDGDFGPITEAAVKQYQRDRGLNDTGVVDQETWDTFLPPKELPEEPPEADEPTVRKVKISEMLNYYAPHAVITNNKAPATPPPRQFGYTMGGDGRVATLDYLTGRAKDSYPETWESYLDRTKKWVEHVVNDCNAVAEALYRKFTGVNIDTKARLNYANWCSRKSPAAPDRKLTGIPQLPGVAVFSGPSAAGITHVGYLLYKFGPSLLDWYVLESRGADYGLVITKLTEREWEWWGVMDRYFDYDVDASWRPDQIIKPEPTPEPEPLTLPATLVLEPCEDGYMRIRKGPGTEYPYAARSEISKVLVGEKIRALEERNGWYRMVLWRSDQGGYYLDGWVNGQAFKRA